MPNCPPSGPLECDNCEAKYFADRERLLIIVADNDAPLAVRLERFLAREIALDSIERLYPNPDGHAGHTFDVDLRFHDGSLQSYVLKIAPPGVRRSGSTDIFRQVFLLDQLLKAGIPVPEIRWSSESDQDLGTPFILMKRCRGRSLIIWDPASCFLRRLDRLDQLWAEGSRLLATVHSVDSERLLSAWEKPTTLLHEIDRWAALVRHSDGFHWRTLLEKLVPELKRSMPAEGPVGLVHGDFQPGNILFLGGKVSALVDWDLAAIGPQAMDLGWYLMMADAERWSPQWRPVVGASRRNVMAAYSANGGPVTRDLDWHQSFAQFRLGVIAGLNLKLHRSGRRVDAIWEKFAPSINPLLQSSFEMLGCRPAE